MSSFIILNSWQGTDQNEVATRLARMFRMEIHQATQIIEKLVKGGAWRMERMISDAQAEIAEKYLRSLGFGVERAPAHAGKPDVAPGPPKALSSRIPQDKARSSSRAQTETRVAKKSSGSGPGKKVEFHGDGWELAKMMLVNWVLTIFTFGFYYFWGKTKVRSYLFEQSSFAGDRFSYHGTGMELLKGQMIFFLMIFGLVSMTTYAESQWGAQGLDIFQSILTLVFFIIFPAILVGAYRYRLSRSAWRGIRFSFRGTRKRAMLLYLKGDLLFFLTLGLYTPFFEMEVKKFFNSNSYFGNKRFEFDGEGKDIFKDFLVALLLFPFTLGLSMIWYKAKVARYSWGHTRVAGGTFQFTASGKQYFILWLTNLLLLIFTLGMAYPWVMVRTRRFVAEHLSLQGNINLDRVVQEVQKSGAVGEGALDVFDIPLDIV